MIRLDRRSIAAIKVAIMVLGALVSALMGAAISLLLR